MPLFTSPSLKLLLKSTSYTYLQRNVQDKEQCISESISLKVLMVWLVVFNVPSTARSFMQKCVIQGSRFKEHIR